MLPQEDINRRLSRLATNAQYEIAVFPDENSCLNCGKAFQEGKIELSVPFSILKRKVNGRVRQLFCTCKECVDTLVADPEKIAEYVSTLWAVGRNHGFKGEALTSNFPREAKDKLQRKLKIKKVDLEDEMVRLEDVALMHLNREEWKELAETAELLIVKFPTNKWGWYLKAVSLLRDKDDITSINELHTDVTDIMDMRF